MLRNLDELMMKMCASKNSGVGVEVDGLFYFYEDFENDDAISRVYRHFGTNKQITLYSMAWAHQKRIKEFMNLYKTIVKNGETERAEKYANVIAKYITAWSDCTHEKALEQVKNMKISYLAIA